MSNGQMKRTAAAWKEAQKEQDATARGPGPADGGPETKKDGTDTTGRRSVQYLEARGLPPETFSAYGGEITGCDRNLIAERLNLDVGTRKLLQQKWGAVEEILWF